LNKKCILNAQKEISDDMTKLDSIPEPQLTALMDLILETAADLEQKKGSAPQKREEALQNDGQSKPSPF
jgi:hypothetical protein